MNQLIFDNIYLLITKRVKIVTKNRELTKEELEDIEWAKAGFTRTEIEEMDRRAARIGLESSYTSEEIMQMLLDLQ